MLHGLVHKWRVCNRKHKRRVHKKMTAFEKGHENHFEQAIWQKVGSNHQASDAQAVGSPGVLNLKGRARECGAVGPRTRVVYQRGQALQVIKGILNKIRIGTQAPFLSKGFLYR